MKKCKKCEEIKLFEAFSLGYNKCKECRNKYHREYWKKNRGRFLERMRIYGRTYGRIDERAEKRLASSRKYKEANKERIKIKQKSYEKSNKHKISAKLKVRYAIKVGVLTREPCETCGIIENIHAHHDDYNKPLNVRWLCAKHHGKFHRQYK